MVQIFNKKQASEQKEGWVMGNNLFFRMHRISDIYFVGGFGTVQWVDVAEYAATVPDTIVLDNPHRTLQVGASCLLMPLQPLNPNDFQYCLSRFSSPFYIKS